MNGVIIPDPSSSPSSFYRDASLFISNLFHLVLPALIVLAASRGKHLGLGTFPQWFMLGISIELFFHKFQRQDVGIWKQAVTDNTISTKIFVQETCAIQDKLHLFFFKEPQIYEIFHKNFWFLILLIKS